MSNENTQANNAPAPQSLVLDEQDISVAVGRTRCLWAQVTPADAGNYTINWSSSNPSIASVSDGNVTAHATGPAVISAWIPGTGLSASCNVEVVPFVPVSSVSVSPENTSLAVGYMTCLAAQVCPVNATNPMVTWSCRDNDIAEVTEGSGIVYAKKVGTTIITATAKNGTTEKTDSCVLTVHDPIPVTGITINTKKVNINVGEAKQLYADVSPFSATEQTVVWTSSNKNVVSVGTYTGEILGVIAGTATITAKTADGGFTASCTVTVNEVLTGADLYIDDVETKNLIIECKNLRGQFDLAYLNGEITLSQKVEFQEEVDSAMNIARADYVLLHPQGNFVYQYFKGRNHEDSDFSPFNRDSYTYPNTGYNNPDDKLAITIIQRALELLTYFEPADDYRYGTYDADTHNALLESGYNDISGKDFQKWSYYDILGEPTVRERTKSNIEMLRAMRLHHNEVAAYVAAKVAPGSRIRETTIYKTPDHKKWGFADVMKTTTTTEYIWEVKPWGSNYRVVNSMAARQLKGYIDAWNDSTIEQNTAVRNEAKPGYSIGKFSFVSAITGNKVVVESNPALPSDVRSGLVHYYPTKDDNDYNYNYAYNYALETEVVPVPDPMYNKTPQFEVNWDWVYDLKESVRITGTKMIDNINYFIVNMAGVIILMTMAMLLAFFALMVL